MIDATTEAGILCVCGHLALSHVNPGAADEQCSACACAAFRVLTFMGAVVRLDRTLCDPGEIWLEQTNSPRVKFRVQKLLP